MLITNFMQGPADSFYANFTESVRRADERWSQWFGNVRAGPFNTQCFADCFKTCNCLDSPQPLPPLFDVLVEDQH